MVVVPTIVPTTHGMPYSRATVAQWLSTPPLSATTAPIVLNRTLQGGSVISQTRIWPGSTVLASSRLRATLARPRAEPGDAGVPRITVAVHSRGAGGASTLIIAVRNGSTISSAGGSP